MPQIASPVPSLPTPARSNSTPSNTIIITALPSSFFHPSLQASLRAHFSTYGSLSAWVSLAGLGRILVVYQEPEPAMAAKLEMDRFVIEGCELEECREDGGSLDISDQERELVKNLPRTIFRVFFGPPTPISKDCSSTIITNDELISSFNRPEPNRLMPPASDKNFLISPPGSPPVGWEQAVEDAPNQANLAEDLCQRLRFLSVGDVDEDGNQDGDQAQAGEIVILPAQPGLKLPALKIQHTERTVQRPGMDIGLVKATIESMIPNRISPTPRPTLSS